MADCLHTSIVSRENVATNDMRNTEPPFPPPYDQIKIGNFSNLEMSGRVLQCLI